MAKRQKTKAFSIQGFDAEHYKTTDAYTRAVGNLFDRATNDIAAGLAKMNINPDKPFQFSDYPSAQATLKRAVNKLTKGMTAIIEQGSRKQWLFACKKNDEFVASIMDTSKLSKARLNKMQDRNLDSLNTFQQRKVDGMNLSQRVWKYTEQFKAQIEAGLDVGLGEGRSAQELSRDLRQNLKEPNRLFRRIRDKRGNLQLSKNAQAFHPGQGVYRSSYKNAMRLTRSEVNMAYREADWLRWQQLDFVIGFEVHRTNHEPQCNCSLCERLKGRYPKTFKFKGWHPQCMCYVTPILTTDEEFDAQELSDLKAALYGTERKQLATKQPEFDGMKALEEWAKENQDAQANWGSTPYFIKDNFVDGSLSNGMKIQSKQIVQTATKNEYTSLADMSEADVQMWRAQWQEVEREFNAIRSDCVAFGIDLGKLEDLIGDALWVSRNESKYWCIDEAKAELSRLKAELKKAKDNDFLNFLKPYNAELDKIRQDARMWGLNTFPVDNAIAKKDKTAVPVCIKEMQSRIANAKAEYNTFIQDAQQAITEATKKKIDATAVVNALALIKADKRDWIMDKDSFKKALEELKSKVGIETVIVPIPNDLSKSSKYINGEDYEFEQSFFNLIDPKKPIRLVLTNTDKGSYSSGVGDLVYIASASRSAKSKWEKKAVIYHEYGHCIDAQRTLWKDPELLKMRDEQTKRLNKKKEYTIWTEKWEDGKGWVTTKETLSMSRIAYIDHKLKELITKVFRMQDETFVKRGITKMDVIEQIGSMCDTIKSINVKYGSGHSTAYFKKTRMKETEYLAHCFENAFLGNRIFQKFMPDVYQEMIAYVKALKPI